jgi:hypothetical protein
MYAPITGGILHAIPANDSIMSLCVTPKHGCDYFGNPSKRFRPECAIYPPIAGGIVSAIPVNAIDRGLDCVGDPSERFSSECMTYPQSWVGLCRRSQQALRS